MRHLVVLALTGSICLAYAPARPAAGQEAEGLTAAQAAAAEALVQSRCSVCHSSASLRRFVERCAERRGAAYLDQFLARHHAPEPAVREAIIAYLTCPPERLPQQ